MGELRRMGHIGYVKSRDNDDEITPEELCFLLWKAELNKELLSFWKAMDS
jgi:hypothetical protein